MGCLVAIALIIIVALFISYPIPAIAILALLCILCYFKIKEENKQNAEKKRFEEEAAERAEKAYCDIKDQTNLPEEAFTVTYKSGYANILKNKTYMWIDNNNLCFFPALPPNSDTANKIEQIQLYQIAIDNIEYYSTRGEIFHENKISGGGGGGTSIGGAVAGAVVAGGAGAVVGSRKKVQDIKSELITHDNRETFINFFIEKEKHSMFFDFKDYNTFEELLPEKAFQIVNTIRSNKVLNKVINQSKSENIAEQIRELAKLKNEGILTEDEFVEKKKILLNKI